MTGIEVEKKVCQDISGSPAQIWQALSVLDDLIFGSISAASDYGELCLDLNEGAVCSEESPERCGFDCRAAVGVRDTTQHNTTHNTPE